MTNLEQILNNDLSGIEVQNIKSKLLQAQAAVKRRLDLGCPPQQYQLLLKQYEAYTAAQVVIEAYEANQK
ncbi:EscE/YscE/SsaE family type III secretion system needle protein co-chaperone [Vibrio parahaemolyticus]|nr:EscE/YscE/SsaE family type III secretion system needle protein co-chaperone [Vibrio parahaemolyticus]EGR3459536.1 EscE/YscE/SsaE family type III secretion system needle protein co-chaperone [Vibrio parahaemolyticus]EJC7186820.1 EscE/YscE/SsaE family type III secretion system needle protein co-chaperone [Vibrio parahaemolyticus]EJG0061553.1 EscE/YscE/SsaE family type III secretion system needle protein co-chaperone [Vibrio parahaemolyticus]EJG0454214.1 EscE/YscE/SsaE family type III secretion